MKEAIMPDAISFSNVSKIYRIPSILPWQKTKKILALQDINFSCPKGKISCLLGPNGAGKTTVIKILAGLVSNDGGAIHLHGLPFIESMKRDSVKIGVMASNDRSFYWRLTGRQNLEFFCALYGFKKHEIKKIVSNIQEELGIEQEADKPFRMYSTGIKQKFLLARALLRDPDILLLDEPTSHIDPIAKDAIHTIIRENFIRKRNVTILLCTHDLYEVQRLADYIILLNTGRVVAEGTPARLKSMINPGTSFVMKFSRMPGTNWARRLPITIIRQDRGRIECVARNKKGISAAIDAAVHHGGKVTGCEERDESIVEIFSRLSQGGAS
jgi:ABC-2 type transport system ATP-binding protein